MSKSFPTPSKTFFILFFLHLFLSLVLRLTGQLEQRIFNEILILKCTLFTGHPVRRVHFALYD